LQEEEEGEEDISTGRRRRRRRQLRCANDQVISSTHTQVSNFRLLLAR
jgi:hypothetical protein